MVIPYTDAIPYPEGLYLLSFLCVFGVLLLCGSVCLTFRRLGDSYNELRDYNYTDRSVYLD